MARTKGSKDKKKRLRRRLLTGAAIGAGLGAAASVPIGRQLLKLRPDRKIDAIRGAKNFGLIGGLAGLGIASATSEESKARNDYIQKKFGKWKDPDAQAIRGTLSGAGIGGAIGATIGAAKLQKSLVKLQDPAFQLKAGKKLRSAQAINVYERKLLSVVKKPAMAGALIGAAGLGYLSTRGANKYNKKYGKEAAYTNNSWLSTFARTKGAKDKKKRNKRIRRLLGTVAGAAIGGTLGGIAGDRYYKNSPMAAQINKAKEVRAAQLLNIVEKSVEDKKNLEVFKLRRDLQELQSGIRNPNYSGSVNNTVAGIVKYDPSVVRTRSKAALQQEAEGIALARGQKARRFLERENKAVQKIVNRMDALPKWSSRIQGVTIGASLGLLAADQIRRKLAKRKNK